MRRCKDCGCEIIVTCPPLPNRTGYYCQQCGKDKDIYETEDDSIARIAQLEDDWEDRVSSHW